MACIAYILGRFPVLSETFISQEIRAMEQSGHKVVIISLRRPEAAPPTDDDDLAHRTIYFSAVREEEKADLMQRYRFKFRRMRSYARGQTAESRASLAANAARLADIMTQHGCDHVHAHFAWNAAAYAIVSARLLKLPVSFTCHGSDVYARPWDLALKCEHADAIFAVAPTIAADLKKITKKTPCHLVYCGVETEQFKPLVDPARKHRRWLFIGRLIDCKGVDDILDAWAMLEPSKRPLLDIVGDGAMKATLQKSVHTQGLEETVRFLGGRPSSWIAEHAPAYYALITAFRQGKDGSRDTSPLVLKEAMAMALPIVTTQFIDIPALVGDECALLCPTASPQALADAVLQLHNLPLEKYQQMGYAGRHRVKQHYTVQHQVARISHLLKL